MPRARARVLSSLLISTLAFAFSVISLNAANAERIKVAYPVFAGDQGYLFVAIKNGYYKQEGLDLDLVQAGGGISTPALISGDVQFSTSGSAALSAILRGAPLRILMIGADRTPYQIWSPRADIRTFNDLKGMQIGIVSRGDTGEIAVRYLLKNRGLPNNFVAFTPLGAIASRMAAAASGTFPAVLLEPLDLEQMKSTGLLSKLHLVTDLSKEVRIPSSGVATSLSIVQNKPDLAMRFLRATLKGQAFVSAHPDAAVQILSGIFKASSSEVKVDLNEMLPLFTKDGMIPADLQKEDMVLRSEMLGLPPGKAPPADQAFDFTFAQKVRADLRSTHWTP